MSKKNTRRHERSLAFQVLYAISFASVNSLDDVRRAFCQSPDNNLEDAADPSSSFAWQLVEQGARSFLNGILDATAKALESGQIQSRA